MSRPLTTARSLVANFGLLTAGEIASKACSLVAFAYAARVLGPTGFGSIEFALAAAFILSLLIDFGLGVYGAREISKSAGLIPSMTRRIVHARCWLTLVAVALLVGLVSVIDRPWDMRVLLLWFGTTLAPYPFILVWVFQGRDLMGHVTMAQVIRQLVFAVAVLALVRAMDDARMVAISELLAVAACAGFTVVMYWQRFGPLHLWPAAWPDRQLLGQSLAIAASQFMWAIKFYFATLVLGFIASGEQVGWFAAALRIVVALHAFVALYFFNLLPSVSRASGESNQTLASLVGGSLRASSWVAMLGCTVGTIGAGPAIRMIYGPSYEQSIIVLQLLVWMLAATLVSAHYRCTLIGCGRQTLELVSTAAGAGSNVILIGVLYPSFGLAGAAAAMLIAELVTCVVSYRLVNATVAPMRAWPQLRGPGLVAVPLAAIMYLAAGSPLWLQASATIALFTIGLRWFDPKVITDLRAVVSPWSTNESGTPG